MDLNVKIIQRSDTSENWNLHNPILNKGEFGYDVNKQSFKIGDGSSTWTSLSYYNEIIDGGDYEAIKSPPLLAASDTWYRGSINRSNLTEINIVDIADEKTITEASESWAAAVNINEDDVFYNDIMCYINGTKLTISGNGTGKIYMNPDSSMVFSSSVDSFSSLIKINGLEILDSSKATTLYRMFRNCYEIRDISLGNFNVENVKNIGGLFANCKKLESITGLDSWNTKNLEDMSMIFAYCDALTTIDDVSNWNTKNVNTMYCTFMAIPNIESLNLTKWDTSKVTTMAYMFSGDEKLTTIGDTKNWDTSNVTNMQTMFQHCSKLKSLNTTNWNTANVIDMKYMFNRCNELTTIGDTTNWNTKNVTSTECMFNECNLLNTLNVSNWNTGKVTSMKGMFCNCSSLTSIGSTTNWDTSNVTNMQAMFQHCSKLKSLNTTNWNTANVIDMKYMFNRCNELTTIGDTTNWNTGKVTSMEAMFCNCSSLTSIGSTTNWDTSNVTNMSYMFDNCSSLEYLDVSNWDVSNVTSISSMFSGGSNGANPFKPTLDVSKWDTSNVTDMSFAFYSQKSGKTLDLRNWDTSKVTTFDHFMAHSSITLAGGQDAVKNWDTSSCINMNAMFYTCRNTVLDLSHFDTSKVTIFDQMFEASSLKQIIGMDKWNTSNGVGFSEMFWNNGSIEEVDLSSFDTRKAKNGVTASDNKTKTSTLEGFFRDDATYGPKKLKKVILGENFSFNGDGTNTSEANKFKMPSVSVIGSDTYWQAEDGTIYAPNEVPDRTYGVYIAISNPNQS